MYGSMYGRYGMYVCMYGYVCMVCMYVIQYLTEVSAPLTFLKIFYYIFSCDNTEEMTLCYNIK